MEFSEIPAEIISLRMRQPYSGDKKIEPQPIVSISQSDTNLGEYELLTASELLIAEPVDFRDTFNLDKGLATGSSYLARITDVDVNNGFSLEVAFFVLDALEFGQIDIGVDEYVIEQMRKIKGDRPRTSQQMIFNTLVQEFCYKHGTDDYFFALAGNSVEDELLSPADINSVSDDHSDLHPNKSNSFCVISRDISFVATEKLITGGTSIYVATKMHRRKNSCDRAVRIVHGSLRFENWENTGQIQVRAKAQLNDIAQSNSSYLKTWDNFGNIEGEFLLHEARDFGIITYKNAQENIDGTTTVTIVEATPDALKYLSSGRIEELEYVEDLPAYLLDNSISFADASSVVSNGGFRQLQCLKIKDEGYDSLAQQITLETEHLPGSGKLVRSLLGEMTQVRRRDTARRAILTGRSANPQLGLLLEENGNVASLRLPKKIKPLTFFVREKVFKQDPTYMQQKAIDIALNTPDIALIQGPPGTGKTTVISAIVERLNEEFQKSGDNLQGRVLLTGFQHDAVENMINRISLNSIPIPKIGKRIGQDEDEITAFENSLNDWCEDIAKTIRDRYPALGKTQQHKEFDELVAQYIQAPTQLLAIEIIRRISNEPVSAIGNEILSTANILLNKLSFQNSLSFGTGADSKYLHAVRLIRARDLAFLDDGPERAADALAVLEDVLTDEERDVLLKAQSWHTVDGLPSFMDEIKNIKSSLLAKFSSPPIFRVEKINKEVLDLITAYEGKISSEDYFADDRCLASLAGFLAELEGDQSNVINALAEYSFALAATCQQSASEKMSLFKGTGGNEDSDDRSYDYVIIDEAARVSPRDLMIPMAQGKHIILVGDHRQLPHIVDEGIARQMENNKIEEHELEWLKESCFEYLFTERLKDLEEQDGIERTVTLDKQYRMHHVLGDFISRNFYERFSPSEKILPGLPDSVFSHNLPGAENKPLAWIDVSVEYGTNEPCGTSWIRKSEAESISEQLFLWMNSPEGKDFTFGVITFYRAQAELIKNALKELGADESRLRIGTVDAFQGMEFDVVFLSMVRTLPQRERIKWKKDNSDSEQAAHRLFGHLCLYNRLNVAMSRQKRLLVVVGDSELLKIDLAEQFVPGLVDFYRTCEKEGVILNWQK